MQSAAGVRGACVKNEMARGLLDRTPHDHASYTPETLAKRTPRTAHLLPSAL